MKSRKTYCTCFTLVLTLAATESKEWSPTTYPNPTTEEGYRSCQRPGKSFVCDPDSLISRESANVVEGVIKDIRNAVDPYANDGCTSHASDFPGFEVTVALMDKMDIADSSPQEAAKDFSVRLFDLWGVGDAACQNGVLLLLSKQDRQVYIYAGKQALQVAPEVRLKVVVDRMRPLLKAGDYNTALEQAVVDLGLILAGAEPQEEAESSYWGLGVFLSIFAGIVGFTQWKSWQQRRGQRKCLKLLEKLKKEQRHAMSTGRYPAASCPICFEDFEDNRPSAPPLPPAAGKGEDGSDKEETSSLLVNPLLDQASQQTRKDHKDHKDHRREAEEPRQGKKRLALPCGHTFCDPCITSWFETHSTCPVCRKPMGGPDENDDDSGPGPSQRRQPPPPRDDCNRTFDRNQQMDLYYDELQFRMLGLHRLYPWYVTNNMVSHASDVARRGQAFDFEGVRQEQMAQASRDRHMHQGQWGGGNAGFGGGSSSGGGGIGGSW